MLIAICLIIEERSVAVGTFLAVLGADLGSVAEEVEAVVAVAGWKKAS